MVKFMSVADKDLYDEFRLASACEYMIGLIEGVMEGMRKAYLGDACAVA